MKDQAINLWHFPVAFRWSFSHASATRSRAENVILSLDQGDEAHFGEACPRGYVTGETLASVAGFLRRYAYVLSRNLQSLEELAAWLTAERDLIDANPAAVCALEMALLDRLGRREGVPLEALLGGAQRKDPLRYSAVLGAGGGAGFLAQALAYRAVGLFDVKMKLGLDPWRNLRRAKLLRHLFGKRLRMRADANNLWRDPANCIAHLTQLRPYLWAVEEPLSAGDLEGAAQVAEALDLKIILDESLCRLEQLDDLISQPSLWVLNLRVSKMGGILRSLELAKSAAARGLPVILGAHVGETSLLTRAQLALAACLPQAPLAIEGAFGTRLLERDLTDQSIMFKRGGSLDPETEVWRSRSGLGLQVKTPFLHPLCSA